MTDQQTVDRVRYYVEVIRAAAGCMQGSTLTFCHDSESAAKRQQASDCAHSDHGIIEVRLDCILNALGVEPWPKDPEGNLVPPPWSGDPDV